MKRKLLLLVVFGLAMAYVEAAVVVYLRELFYPDGFTFPLREISLRLGGIEVVREAATLLMLLSFTYIAEKTKRGRFACFIFLFGLWDIGYYFWLWVTIGWPESLLTWDILFLIPLAWTGPVLAPILVSSLFIATGLLYFTRPAAAEGVQISRLRWILTAVSAVVIFIAFVWNHSAAASGSVPGRFPWEVFAAGLALATYLLVRTGLVGVRS